MYLSYTSKKTIRETKPLFSGKFTETKDVSIRCLVVVWETIKAVKKKGIPYEKNESNKYYRLESGVQHRN